MGLKLPKIALGDNATLSVYLNGRQRKSRYKDRFHVLRIYQNVSIFDLMSPQNDPTDYLYRIIGTRITEMLQNRHPVRKKKCETIYIGLIT